MGNMILAAPDDSVGKKHVWSFAEFGQECAGGFFSEQTRGGGAISAPKFDLPDESVGPSSHEFSSSSHHSVVATVEDEPCPLTARSFICVDPTGIIWK